MQSSLHGALDRDEFVLHYHPQIDLATRSIIGVEALIRWHRPGHGLTSPGAFIPIAEETGMIVPMGEWVLRTACRQLARWDAAGFPALTMCVNVSVRQLQHKSFVDMVAATLRETRVAPGRVELELTETLLASDADESIEILGRLRSLGVRLSLDDFGTGYSSLGYVRQLPISRLKIDRSFVHNVHTDSGNAAIARAILTLGRSLDVEVLAEGVETSAEREWLTAAGCRLAQGFAFGHPMDEAAMTEILQAIAARAA